MKTALLLNGAAGSVEAQGQLAHDRAQQLGWGVHFSGDLESSELARELAESGYDMVVAGGGDGTVRQVVQGLNAASRRVVFGVLPLGTGNDLARALRMPLEVEPALEALARAEGDSRIAPIDLLSLTHGNSVSVCANAVNGGLAPLITQQLDAELKAKLGPLAFLWAALGSLKQLQSWPVRYRVDGGAIRESRVVAFVVANGGTVGGGVQVAPVAKLDDGFLDLVVISAEASIAELTIAAIQAKFGDLFESNCVEHVRAQSIQLVEQPADLQFSVDGEIVSEPVQEVHVLPAALRAVMGERRD